MVSVAEAVKIWRGQQKLKKRKENTVSLVTSSSESRQFSCAYQRRLILGTCFRDLFAYWSDFDLWHELLRVKCGSSGYCFLCADCNISFTLNEERGSDRSRTRALRQEMYDQNLSNKGHLKLLPIHTYCIVLSLRCLNLQMVCLTVWSLHSSAHYTFVLTLHNVEKITAPWTSGFLKLIRQRIPYKCLFSAQWFYSSRIMVITWGINWL